jgi:predicted DNA-binding transcriptional regulator AlpA
MPNVKKPIRPISAADDRLVARAEIAELYGVTPLSVYLWGKKGLLPEPIRLTKRTIRYRLSEVRAALECQRPAA